MTAATAIQNRIDYRKAQGATVDEGWSQHEGDFYVVRNGEGIPIELIAKEDDSAYAYQLGKADTLNCYSNDADLFRHVVEGIRLA